MKFFKILMTLFIVGQCLVLNAQQAQPKPKPQATTVKKPIAKKKKKKVVKPATQQSEFQQKGAATPAKVSGAQATFVSKTINMGHLNEDAVVTKQFEFTNTGSSDLIILGAKGSCGCTEPQYPMQPIRPGEKGSISVTYTARNKVGPQKPEITITTNGTPRAIKLTLETWVDQIPGGVKN